MSTPDALIRGIDQAIERHGFFVQAVLPDRSGPGYCYSIGFAAVGHPELCAFGLDPHLAHSAIDHAFGRIARGQRLAADRKKRIGLGPLRDVSLVAVPTKATHPAIGPLHGIGSWSARRAMPLPRPTALQICWPVDGKMPWERTAAERCDQPVLADGDSFLRREPDRHDPHHPTCPLCANPRNRSERRAAARSRHRAS